MGENWSPVFEGGGDMKAISIKQPWAWAIFHGKPVENRSWHCKYRGPLLIHASKSFDHDGFRWLFENQLRLNIKTVPKRDEFKLGGIIGQVDMIDCVSYHPSPFFFGPWGHVYDDPEPLPFFPCKGKLGIFEVDYAVK